MRRSSCKLVLFIDRVKRFVGKKKPTKKSQECANEARNIDYNNVFGHDQVTTCEKRGLNVVLRQSLLVILVDFYQHFFVGQLKEINVYERAFSIFKNKTSEPRRHAVEMYASAIIAFTHLYTADGAL